MQWVLAWYYVCERYIHKCIYEMCVCHFNFFKEYNICTVIVWKWLTFSLCNNNNNNKIWFSNIMHVGNWLLPCYNLCRPSVYRIYHCETVSAHLQIEDTKREREREDIFLKRQKYSCGSLVKWMHNFSVLFIYSRYFFFSVWNHFHSSVTLYIQSILLKCINKYFMST